MHCVCVDCASEHTSYPSVHTTPFCTIYSKWRDAFVHAKTIPFYCFQSPGVLLVMVQQPGKLKTSTSVYLQTCRIQMKWNIQFLFHVFCCSAFSVFIPFSCNVILPQRHLRHPEMQWCKSCNAPACLLNHTKQFVRPHLQFGLRWNTYLYRQQIRSVSLSLCLSLNFWPYHSRQLDTRHSISFNEFIKIIPNPTLSV